MTKPSATAKQTAIATRAGAAPATQSASGRKAGAVLQPANKSAAKIKPPGAPVAANTGEAMVIQPSIGDKFLGVGGQLSICRLAMVVNGRASEENFVDFELAPARRSTYDRQGQAVPGANAGMEFDIEPATAILPVPGGRPIHQGMGIKSETIEFVGAFIAHDEFYGASDIDHYGTPDNAGYLDSSGGNRHLNAWERSQKLAQAARQNREMILQMGWASSDEGPTTRILFEDARDNKGEASDFRVRIKRVKRIYATQQRVYYRVVLSVTNREDLWKSPYAAGNTAFEVPSVLSGQLGLRTESVYVAGDPSNEAEQVAINPDGSPANSTRNQRLDQIAVIPATVQKYRRFGLDEIQGAKKDALIVEKLEYLKTTVNLDDPITSATAAEVISELQAKRNLALADAKNNGGALRLGPRLAEQVRAQQAADYFGLLIERSEKALDSIKQQELYGRKKHSVVEPDIKLAPKVITPASEDYSRFRRSADYDPTGRRR